MVARARRGRPRSGAAGAARAPRSRRRPTTSRSRRSRRRAERGDEVDRGGDAGEQLVGQRAELEALGHRVARRQELVGAQRLEQRRGRRRARRSAGRRTCRASRPAGRRPSRRGRARRARCGARRRRGAARRPRARARATVATGGRVPSRLEAAVIATSRVRSVMASSEERSSSPVAGSSRSHRTVTPARSAAWIHGRTLESWSSSQRTISSPGDQVRASVREKSYVSAVALRPWTTPSGTPPTRSAIGGAEAGDGLLGVALADGRGAALRQRSGQRAGDRLADDARGLGAAGVVEVGDPGLERGELGAEGGDVEGTCRPTRR